MSETRGFEFGEFLLDTEEAMLYREGSPVPITPKTFQLLLTLIENRGHLVRKDALMNSVWSESFVEEGNLTFTMSMLRKALNDSPDHPRFIETVPRRGYRFIADVNALGPEPNGRLQPSASPEKANGTDIPHSATAARRLFGRSHEIAAVLDLLHREDVRLVTLTGAGGSGKTSLARVVLESSRTDFPDGIVFVELAAISDPHLLPAAVAQALGVKEAGNESFVDTLRSYLRTRQLLLVLDNFEQIISAAPFVAELLAATEKLKIIVTSRAALRFGIEQEVIVPTLACPPNGNGQRTVQEIRDFPSVSLFTERARDANSQFDLTNENAASVAGICAKLDGLPLAIELAAARIRLLNPDAILERLKDPLRLLKSSDPDLPPRQQTMRAAIAWSYDLLDADEQTLFRRLAVFSGGFTVEAAESVCGNIGELDVLDGLESLLQTSLLRRIDDLAGESRLQFLETIREFAAEKLAEDADDETETRNRHLEYFLAAAKETELGLMGPDQARILDSVEAERDNYRASLEWTRKLGDERELKLAASLGALWLFRGYLTEGILHITDALARYPNAPLPLRTKSLTWLGQVIWVKGDYEKTITVCSEGLRLAREINYPIFAAQALFFLGMSYWYRFHDAKQAVASLEESLGIYREVGYDAGIVFTLVVLAAIHQTKNDLEPAEKLLQESLTVAERTKNNLINSIAKVNYGRLETARGNLERAKEFCRESLQLRRVLSDRWGLVQCLEPLAVIALKEGDTRRAGLLLGAIELQLESLGASPPLIFRADHEFAVRSIRALLDEETYSCLISEGRKLTTTEVVTLAMEESARLAPTTVAG
jgi:predicted ATPase/DNA-binding winged helix-turn-helix (wHTH) protein